LEVVVLVIRMLEPDESATALVGGSSLRGLREGSLVGFIAERDRVAVGFIVAESHPQVLHVHRLEGETEICLLLVKRLVRLSGEREVSVWCPIARPDVRQILEEMGFARLVRNTFQGRPADLYRWEREDD
jgi:hypothetical protein